MTKPTGKKPGRSRKLSEWTLRFGEDQSKWNKYLRSVGLPEEKRSTKELLECDLLPSKNDSDRKGEPRFLGDRLRHRSFTQQTNSEMAPLEEAAANEGIVLSPEWLGYLKYMAVVAENLSPKDNGQGLKELALKDARSRHFHRPPEFPEEIGTPAEFKKHLTDHEMEVRYTVSRRETTIRIRVYQLPPDEDEDLDPADEPAGYWEGLTWFPGAPE